MYMSMTKKESDKFEKLRRIIGFYVDPFRGRTLRVLYDNKLVPKLIFNYAKEKEGKEKTIKIKKDIEDFLYLYSVYFNKDHENYYTVKKLFEKEIEDIDRMIFLFFSEYDEVLYDEKISNNKIVIKELKELRKDPIYSIYINNIKMKEYLKENLNNKTNIDNISKGLNEIAEMSTNRTEPHRESFMNYINFTTNFTHHLNEVLEDV